MSKYTKGQSGNPTGKKPGTLNKRTRFAKLLEPHAEELIDKIVHLALDGDVNALRVCIERLIPKATSQPIQLDINEIDFENIDKLSVIGKQIVKSVSEGELTPDEGHKLFNILDKQRNLIQFTDLIKKVEEIEELMKN